MNTSHYFIIVPCNLEGYHVGVLPIDICINISSISSIIPAEYITVDSNTSSMIYLTTGLRYMSTLSFDEIIAMLNKEHFILTKDQ